MEDFIGNNAKLIVEWGQIITLLIIGLCSYLIYKIGKNNKYYLPKGILKYFSAITLIFIILLSSLVFFKVTSMKPRMSNVLSALDSLQNKPAPEFEFNLLSDNTKKNIKDYRGNVVLLNYWATWCAPCIKEMPELNRLQKKYEDKGLVVIVLSDEDKDKLIEFAQKRPFDALAAYSTDFDWAGIQSERPMTFLLNKEGIIVEYFTGGYNFNFFETKILKHL